MCVLSDVVPYMVPYDFEPGREREGRERENGEGECVCPLGRLLCDSLRCSLMSTSLMRERERV